MFSFVFLFEGLPGVGAALSGVASGATWRTERLPFGARDSVVGKAERGGSLEEMSPDYLRVRQGEDRDSRR